MIWLKPLKMRELNWISLNKIIFWLTLFSIKLELWLSIWGLQWPTDMTIEWRKYISSSARIYRLKPWCYMLCRVAFTFASALAFSILLIQLWRLSSNLLAAKRLIQMIFSSPPNRIEYINNLRILKRNEKK